MSRTTRGVRRALTSMVALSLIALFPPTTSQASVPTGDAGGSDKISPLPIEGASGAAAVTLDGHLRQVSVRCTRKLSNECIQYDLRVDGKRVNRTRSWSHGWYGWADHYAIHLPGDKALIAIVAQRGSRAFTDLERTGMLAAKLYRLAKGKLVAVRNVTYRYSHGKLRLVDFIRPCT